MDFKQELRRVRREIQPVILAGVDIAEELGEEVRSRVAECLKRHERLKIVYICSHGCFSEDEIRESIEAQKTVSRAGMVPACPHVMFPPDRKKPLERRKMKYSLMDVCDVFLICGNHWSDEMWLEIGYAIARGMEIRTDHDFDRPVIPARRVMFARRNAAPLLMSLRRLAA